MERQDSMVINGMKEHQEKEKEMSKETESDGGIDTETEKQIERKNNVF